jgi:hypothetical protein
VPAIDPIYLLHAHVSALIFAETAGVAKLFETILSRALVQAWKAAGQRPVTLDGSTDGIALLLSACDEPGDSWGKVARIFLLAAPLVDVNIPGLPQGISATRELLHQRVWKAVLDRRCRRVRTLQALEGGESRGGVKRIWFTPSQIQTSAVTLRDADLDMIKRTHHTRRGHHCVDVATKKRRCRIRLIVTRRKIVALFQSYRDTLLCHFYCIFSSAAGQEAAFGPNDADKSANGHEELDDPRAVEDVDEGQVHALAQPQAQALAEAVLPEVKGSRASARRRCRWVAVEGRADPHAVPTGYAPALSEDHVLRIQVRTDAH